MLVLFCPARSWLKTWTGWWGRRCAARCWNLEMKFWGKCRVQIAQNWCWAWCFISRFVVLKFLNCGVKIMVGRRMSRANKLVPTYGKSMLRRDKIAAALIYCHLLLLKPKQPTTRNTPMGTQPQPFRPGPTWPNSTIPPGSRCCENGSTVQVKLSGWK